MNFVNIHEPFLTFLILLVPSGIFLNLYKPYQPFINMHGPSWIFLSLQGHFWTLWVSMSQLKLSGYLIRVLALWEYILPTIEHQSGWPEEREETRHQLGQRLGGLVHRNNTLSKSIQIYRFLFPLYNSSNCILLMSTRSCQFKVVNICQPTIYQNILAVKLWIQYNNK